MHAESPALSAPLFAPNETLGQHRELVGHVVAALSRETTLERLYRHAIDALATALQVDRAALLIFDHQASCRFVAWRGISDAYRAAVDGHSPWGPRDLDATPILVGDVELDPTLTPYLPILRAEGIRAALFLPLVGRQCVWGKFMLYCANRRAFTPEEVDVAQLIVREIAAALDWRERDTEMQEERQLFATGPTVVFKWRNADGWPVDYVSANLRAVFGFEWEGATNGAVSYASIVHADDLSRVAAEVDAHLLAGAERFEQEYRIVRADGRSRVVSDFTKVVRNAEGAVTHFLGYLVDITDRRAQEAEQARSEERVQHAQKLESLGLLAGGIAHDFNNLLVGVLGNASLAIEELPEHSPARPLLDDLQVAARRAAELTRQLLAYSGKGQFVVEPIDVTVLVRDMGRLMAAAVSKKAHMATELREGLPAVRADPTQVRQVVMNLITNASDALGDAPGTITIRTRRMHASRAWLSSAQVGMESAEGDYVVLEVADTGEGISEDVMPRLFDPFYSTRGPGRGLGLAAVLGIVRSHRGAVRMTSFPDAGTTVTVLLPVDASVSVQEPVQATPLEGRGTVLVVDDDAAALRVAARILERVGYTVLTADHGRAALEVYAERGPMIDLVLLDLTMPELSGWETLRELRHLDPAVIVLLMSGYSQESGASSAGAAGFLAKPYAASELRDVVSALVQRRRLASSAGAPGA